MGDGADMALDAMDDDMEAYCFDWGNAACCARCEKVSYCTQAPEPGPSWRRVPRGLEHKFGRAAEEK